MDIALMIIKVVGVLIGGLAALQEMTKQKEGGKERSRRAILLLVLGLGSAVAAEVVDLTIKRKADEQTLQRNSDLLAQVQRSLHPLFPLTVHVFFNSLLTEPQAGPLRQFLQTRLAQAKRKAAQETKLQWTFLLDFIREIPILQGLMILSDTIWYKQI